MKTRNGFVSNSSSTSFIIINKTNKKLNLVDFVKETPYLIEDFIEQYNWHKEEEYNQQKLIESAEMNNEEIRPGENICTFGDEDGTLIGKVYDYMLRDGGESDSFKWQFYEYNR